MTLILTACTMRKRFSPDEMLISRTLRVGTTQSVGEEWRQRLKQAKTVGFASEVYAGRGMSEAKAAAEVLGADVTVASAGLGLVPLSQLIPSYNLTVSPGSEDTIFKKLPEGTTAFDWWSQVCSNEQIERLAAALKEDPSRLLLVSLPHAYLAMLAPLIMSLAIAKQGRLRILTGSTTKSLGPALSAFQLPYDQRLDGPDSPLKGTMGDFASRALKDFVTEILVNHPLASIADHAEMVRARQIGWRLPTRKTGRRVDDNEALQLMRKYWDTANGSSSRLLRILRDEMDIACEQGRFARLASVVRNEVAER